NSFMRHRPPHISPPSLPDALPIYRPRPRQPVAATRRLTIHQKQGRPPQAGPRFLLHVLPQATPADLAPGADHHGRHAALEPRKRSEEHTSELQSRENLVCRLLLEK